MRNSTKTPAEKTFMNFINRTDDAPAPRVIDESDFGYFERDSIYISEKRIKHLFNDFIGDPDSRMKTYHLDSLDDVKFILSYKSMIAVSEDETCLLGGVDTGTIFVLPEHRGKGIAKAMHILIAEEGIDIFSPSHFSTGGYAARVAAHKEICERAFARGDDVNPLNMAAYDIDAGVTELDVTEEETMSVSP